MAPRLNISMSSGFKKGTQIYYSFLSKSPSKQIASRFLSGAPMERDALLQSLFYLSFQVPSKGALPPEPLSTISHSPW